MNLSCGQNRELFRRFSAVGGYEGWMIGKMTFRRRGMAKDANKASHGARVVKRKACYAVIEADGDELQASMLLIAPKENVTVSSGKCGADSAEKAVQHSAPQTAEGSVRLASHAFSTLEIMDFTDDVQDFNPIHRTKHPVVPGLLLVEWFWAVLGTEPWNVCECEFRSAAYAGQELVIWRRDGWYYCTDSAGEQILWQAHNDLCRINAPEWRLV